MTISKTADLRELITTELKKTTGAVYHRRATKEAEFPYKVYSLRGITLGDLARDDLELTVDIWDRSPNTKTIDEIGDQIEKQLNAANLPQETILPTFFRTNRYPVEEENKDIQHIQLTFLIELYETETEV